MLRNSILNSNFNFFKNSLIDKEYNGVFSAANSSGRSTLCVDKQLIDQNVSILALLCINKLDNVSEDLKSIISGLVNMKDPEYVGYLELTDRSWHPHLAGHVKNIFSQFLTCFTLLKCGELLDDKNLLDESFNLLDTIINSKFSKSFSKILSRDWTKVIDDHIDLKTISIGILTLVKAISIVPKDTYIDFLNGLVRKFNTFFDEENGGMYDTLSSNGKPLISYGKKLSSLSLAILAIESLTNSEQKQLLKYDTDNIIEFISKYLQHPIFKNYWNHSTVDGVVTSDATTSYYNSTCPFPVVLSADQALLFIATNKLLKTKESSLCKDLMESSLEALSNFTDSKFGGAFMGESNWFSSPTEPTVPLGRLFHAPEHYAGALYSSNSSYIPLQEKPAISQALSLIAFSQAEKESISIPKMVSDNKTKLDKLDLSKFTLKKDITSKVIRDFPKSNLKIDLDAYRTFLRNTKNFGGYGLTSYPSTIGLKADNATQIFSSHHVLSDLSILKEDIADKDILIKNIQAAQNKFDGGFGEKPTHPCDTFTTYCGVLALYILDAEPADKQHCIDFLQACQNPDGGFGLVPGYRSDLWHTNLAIISLLALDSEPLHLEDCLKFISSCYKEDGSYSIVPGAPSDVFACHRAISTLLLLGYRPNTYKETLNWVKSCQSENGGFRYKPTGIESLIVTYHALSIIYLLEEEPIYNEECKVWIRKHQNSDGGFSRVIGAPSDTTDEGFAALQSSFILEKSLNPYWVAIIN